MTRFIIVDDDVSIRKIIRNIIEQYQLGTVIAECEDGEQGERVICDCQPDIVLVDLLLPVQDGVQLIEKIRGACPSASFIMISQASSQPLISQAYRSGIEFFIHKPINVLEIVSIINKVEDNRKLRQAMSLICRTTAQYSNPLLVDSADDKENGKKARIYQVFSDLGIIGETGAKNMYQLAQLIEAHKQVAENNKYQLFEQYQQLSLVLNQDAKTIEQRVRRTITKALQNLAGIGVEDYYNEHFQTYGTTLFDFKEVRTEMDFIRGKGNYRGKINVRKFIEGLLFSAGRDF
ncbi:MAG: response regulator [Veillonellales bacterium]